MFVFWLDNKTGVPPYLQLVQQVQHAVVLGYLQPGDQLPLIRDVVGRLAINPNTVSKAYQRLEQEGLVTARPGVGTFVAERASSPPVPPATHTTLRQGLERWLRSAHAAGLNEAAITALVATARRELGAEGAA